MKKQILILIMLHCFIVVINLCPKMVCAQDSYDTFIKHDDQISSDQLKIRLIFEDKAVTAVLNEYPAAKDFVSMLPLTLVFEDYNDTEKISYLPRKLKIQNSPDSCKPTIGTFAYYVPWGNLAIFYRDFRQSENLVPLGQMISHMDNFPKKNFTARIEREE